MINDERLMAAASRQMQTRTGYPAGYGISGTGAVFMLQKLIFRNEPDLAPLFSDVETLQEGNNLYHSSTDIQEEIDRIVFQLYSLTGEEERVIRASFSV